MSRGAGGPALALFSEGLAHQQAGRLAAARVCYERALALDPGQTDGRFLLGQTLYDSGEHATGEAMMRAAIAARPQAANYHAGLALSLFNAGRLSAAKDEFWAALQGLPQDPSLWRGMALCCIDSGELDAASEAARVWAQLQPGDAEAARLNAQLESQRQYDCGVALEAEGRHQEACAAWRAALVAAPGAVPVLLRLGNRLAALGEHAEAEACYLRAIDVEPAAAAAHFNLAMLRLDQGRRLDAASALERAAERAPDDGLIAAHLLFQKLHLCRWDGIETLVAKVRAAVEAGRADVPPFVVFAMPGTDAALQRRCAEHHSACLRRAELPAFRRSAPRRPGASEGRKRLRIGYLSSDFKNHATAYLMIEMLEAHDRARFEFFLLSYGIDDGSELRGRLERAGEHFIDLAGQPEAHAVQCIADLDLDVLVDLKGYTEGNRSDWLQYRLAPVQVNWLGYPGTLGAPWADVLFADAVVAPLEHSAQFSERVVHLPGCYQPNSRARPCAARPTRAVEGLPEEALVLCSFNQTYKLTPEVFAVWLEALRETPHAVLWLWASNPWAEDELRRVAQAAGVDPTRLIFAEGRAQPEHLARLPLADLALDTFPCNGHTTTSDALWAGVPVLTWQGEAFAARVASSLLAAAGLDDLIAVSLADYRSRLLRWCADAAWRADLAARAGALRETSPLFDATAFARKLEAAYLELATERGCAWSP